MSTLEFWVNDRLVEAIDEPLGTVLLHFLRKKLGLKGTKEGCGEGDCGACTVAVLDFDALNRPVYRAVNSCLLLLPMVARRRIYTVEGLAQGERLHTAQQAVVDNQASQCGFCTPGVVMSIFEATYRANIDKESDLDAQMCGNICRCTGYRPIRDALRSVAGTRPKDSFSRQLQDSDIKRAACGSTQETPAYITKDGSFISPSSLESLFKALDENPKAKPVCGGTDLTLALLRNRSASSCLVSLERIDDLKKIEDTGNSLVLGSAIVLTDLEEMKQTALQPIIEMLAYFASRQIKHRATIGGNICNASPVGDLSPVLLALNAKCLLRSKSAKRSLPIDQFFIDYKKTALQEGEILEAIEIPHPPKAARISSYKVSKRKEMDISSVAASFFLITDRENKVEHIRLAYGGLKNKPARAYSVERALVGQSWSMENLLQASLWLSEDFQPIDDLRASSWYRNKIALNLLKAFFLETQEGSTGRTKV